ncbi:hypothetical protein DOT_2490 [Desulfosporosinus sp. OT]|nr:hypothetical protein DOT_2490 [Desulfosporosinus sp. OT]
MPHLDDSQIITREFASSFILRVGQALVKKIVDLHKALLECTSNWARGTTFGLRIINKI